MDLVVALRMRLLHALLVLRGNSPARSDRWRTDDQRNSLGSISNDNRAAHEVAEAC
jgi:hypothetical protein